MSVTAKDLIEALRRHHEPPPSKPVGGYLVTEIRAPESDRRADALWLPINTANRGDIIGYETKVTRQDVLAELRDTQKADAWERYCSRWWLLIPDTDIIEGLDIPERWGIVTPQKAANRRTLNVVRRAPALHPQDSRKALGTVLAKLIYGGETVEWKLRNAFAREKQATDMLEAAREENRKLRIAAGSDITMRRGERNLLVDVLAEIDRLGGFNEPDSAFRGESWSVTPEAIARAVLAAQGGRSELERLTKELDGAALRATQVAKRLELLRAAATA